MDIDYTKANTTTVLTCGKTNIGHHVFIKQGIDSWHREQAARIIYDMLSAHAPACTLGSDWELHDIEITDYRSWNRGKYYMITARFGYRKGKDRYWTERELPPRVAQAAYEELAKWVIKDDAVD